MPVTTTGGDLQDLARVDQPGFYDVRNAPLLTRLRQEAPVFYYAELGTWVLSKYHDVKYASRTPGLFSVRKGILLNDARYGESIATASSPTAQSSSQPWTRRVMGRSGGPSRQPSRRG